MRRAVLIACGLGLALGCREAPPAPAVVDGVVGDGASARAFRLDVASGRMTPLAPAPSYPYALTPEGGVLLGIADDIFHRDASGRLRPVAVSPGLDWHPRLHPDGRRVLFESSRDGFRDLYATQLDDPEALTRLTDDPEGNFDGAWSSDGDRICFSSSRHGQLDLFVMRADGREQTRWTRHVGDAVRCAFAPSGRSVAYVSARDGRDDVLLARGPGVDPENLTAGLGPREAHVERFAWHPTQDRLLVALVGRALGEVWLIDGAARRRLTPAGARDTEPAWSPDGEAVLLVREDAGLLSLRADGGDPRRVHPAATLWRPRWRRPSRESP